MKEYPKIQSIFKRDEKTHKFLFGEWSLPEFDYLKNNQWEFTEKVDGTNVRVWWEPTSNSITFMGRTDNAQMPTFLFTKLTEAFNREKMCQVFDSPTCLYGEGYGARIQKGGGNYIPNGVDFVLFDVRIGDIWLKREAVADIANNLEIKAVPIVGCGTIDEAIAIVQPGFKSQWGDFQAEGLVLRPVIELQNRLGHRIITKLKTKDFRGNFIFPDLNINSEKKKSRRPND